MVFLDVFFGSWGSRLPEELAISQVNKADFIQAHLGLSRRSGQEFFHGRWHEYAFVNIIENVVQKDVLVELVGGEVC